MEADVRLVQKVVTLGTVEVSVEDMEVVAEHVGQHATARLLRRRLIAPVIAVVPERPAEIPVVLHESEAGGTGQFQIGANHEFDVYSMFQYHVPSQSRSGPDHSRGCSAPSIRADVRAGLEATGRRPAGSPASAPPSKCWDIW